MMLFNCQFGAYENKLYYAGFSKYHSGMREGIPQWERENCPFREMGNFTGRTMLLGSWNPRRSAFDHSNLFQSLKQHSVNIEHRLKSKLA